ncbi:NAD(P)-dependent oxidoreductase [Chitinophaga sp. NPDC101104]|uniref:NAD(P)-dependent oxidoreductase n=1 Tax=Chitinophaga sp. NPDC101104 TaxID=3390561 RepID=UPI003CFDB6D5
MSFCRHRELFLPTESFFPYCPPLRCAAPLFQQNKRTMKQHNERSAAVLGLGMMGATLAKLLLAQGYDVTVWNRSNGKSIPLAEAGAKVAATPEEAVSAGNVIVMCVHDYAAANAILAGTEAADWKGKVLVQLTSGSPAEAERLEAWAEALGAGYLDGAIQAAPQQMGREDTPLYISGKKSAWGTALPVLKTFAGAPEWLGEGAGLASSVDLATLSGIYGTLMGFFHGARIMEHAGFPVDKYAGLLTGILSTFGEFIKYEGQLVHENRFAKTESPLSISVDASARILEQAKDAGINSAFPEYLAGMFRRAADMGLADEELSAMIKVLRA